MATIRFPRIRSGSRPRRIFGRALKALRERARLKIREVPKATGIAVATTGDYFSGRHLPSDPRQLARILEVCGESDPVRPGRASLVPGVPYHAPCS